MIDDNPHVRADLTCPLCLGEKHRDFIACWPCWCKHLKYGSPEAVREADRVIATRERVLAGAWWVQ